MAKILHIFDFDGTLMDTFDDIKGKQIWEKITGEKFPKKGWWTHSESMDLFLPIKPIESVYNMYIEVSKDPKIKKMLLTGRNVSFRKSIDELLEKFNISFDELQLNTMYDTLNFKMAVLFSILSVDKPDEIFFYDDRDDHAEAFKDFAEKNKDRCKIHIIDSKTL